MEHGCRASPPRPGKADDTVLAGDKIIIAVPRLRARSVGTNAPGAQAPVRDPLIGGQQGGELVAGPVRIPSLPVQWARLHGWPGVRVLRPPDPLFGGQQGGELVAGPVRIPSLPYPVGEVGAGGQGTRMLRTHDPFEDGQQGGEAVAGPGRIPRLPSPVGEVESGGQGVRQEEAVANSEEAAPGGRSHECRNPVFSELLLGLDGGLEARPCQNVDGEALCLA